MRKLDMSTSSFKSNRKFYDDKNYPRGMSRSGDFTLAEVNILENHGIALQDLAAGTRNPGTDEEERFVKVCAGELEAESKIERTWKKYQGKVMCPKQFHTLFGRAKVDVDDSDSEPLDLDD